MLDRLIKALVLLASVLAAGATAATAAAVETEGPYYVSGHQVLSSGETLEVTSTAKTSFVFKDKTSKQKIECKELKLKGGATLNGSGPKTGGSGHQTLELSSCKGGAKEESLTGCEPEGGKVSSVALLDTVGYSSSARTGPVLVLFKPATGTTVASIKFTGEKCVATSATLTGNLIGEARVEGKAIEPGSNEVEATQGEVVFGAAEKTIWIESEGSLTSVKGSLSILEAPVTLEGTSTVALASKAAFGILPRIEAYTELIALTPNPVTFHGIREEEQELFFEDKGSDKTEYVHLKLGGSEAGDYEITDKHLCTVTTWNQLSRCGLTIKMLTALAGDALVEGEVQFVGGRKLTFRAVALVN